MEVQSEKTVVNKRLPTKVKYKYKLSYHCYTTTLQDECKRLLSATIDGDEEVVSTLINDGVDMDAVIHEVCYTYKQVAHPQTLQCWILGHVVKMKNML